MSTKIGIRAWIDFAFKKISGKKGNEICLVSLLNSVLDLPSPIESVQYLNPFSLKEFQEDKFICVDVKATDSQGRVFVVEVQIAPITCFIKRATYYAAKTFTEQLPSGGAYSSLKATYAVCLLTGSIWTDDRLHHHFRMTAKESGAVLLDSIEIHTVEFGKTQRNERIAPDRECSRAVVLLDYSFARAQRRRVERIVTGFGVFARHPRATQDPRNNGGETNVRFPRKRPPRLAV